jgi:hypothetical protein
VGKRLSEKNPFLRDPEKKKRLMLSTIAASQRQEGIEISEARVEEVYRIVFEEPPIAFFRLTHPSDGRKELFRQALSNGAAGIRFDVARRDLAAIETAPLAYWVPGEILALFRSVPTLEPGAGDARQGLATTDDSRWLRRFWEVAPTDLGHGRSWVAFAKGGDFSRFYYDNSLVVRWRDEGAQLKSEIKKRYGSIGKRIYGQDYYFTRGLTWAYRSQRGFGPRILDGLGVHGHVGHSFFPRRADDLYYLLGILSSSCFEYLLRLFSSFGKYEVGMVREVPCPSSGIKTAHRIGDLARLIHDAKLARDKGNEISTRFKNPWLSAELRERPDRPLAEALDALLSHEVAADAEIQAWYAELDATVFDAYGLSSETRETVIRDLGSRPPELIWPQMEGKSAEQKRVEHVLRLLSFCVKRIVEGDDDGIVPLVACNNEPPLEQRILGELGTLVGADQAHILEGQLASELRRKVPGYKRAESIGDFLANAYFEHHVRLYKRRPVFWHLASAPEGGGTPAFAVLVHYHRFTKDALRKLRGTHVRSFIERRERDLALARQANRTDEALEIQRDIEEAQAFDKRLQGLEEGRFPIRVPWKKAAEQPKGWSPDIDDGVKVNILPLQTAGLLRIARVVSTKGDEDDE